MQLDCVLQGTPGGFPARYHKALTQRYKSIEAWQQFVRDAGLTTEQRNDFSSVIETRFQVSFTKPFLQVDSRPYAFNNKCISRTDTNPPFTFDISPSPLWGGSLTPKRGEDTSGTRVCPHAKFGVNLPAGCREIVDKKANKKTYSKTKTSPFALTSEWRAVIYSIVKYPVT